MTVLSKCFSTTFFANFKFSLHKLGGRRKSGDNGHKNNLMPSEIRGGERFVPEFCLDFPTEK